MHMEKCLLVFWSLGWEFTVLGSRMIYGHPTQALTPAGTRMQQGGPEQGDFALPQFWQESAIHSPFCKLKGIKNDVLIRLVWHCSQHVEAHQQCGRATGQMKCTQKTCPLQALWIVKGMSFLENNTSIRWKTTLLADFRISKWWASCWQMAATALVH